MRRDDIEELVAGAPIPIGRTENSRERDGAAKYVVDAIDNALKAITTAV